MGLSLYDATVPTFLQITGAVEGFLAKGAAHFKEKGGDVNEMFDARLFTDMAPFKFQIQAMAHHSLGALRSIQSGQAGPPAPIAATDYAGLQKHITETREALQKVKPDEVNGCEGKDVVFTIRDTKLPFTAEGFLQTFSLPNFFFHATTAYDLLRNKGVPVGKRDFLGRMRLKG
jgi:hypothetical protein